MTAVSLPHPRRRRAGREAPRWLGGPLVRLAALGPLAVWAFLTWADVVSRWEATLAAWLLGDRAQSPGRALILFPDIERSQTFVLRVTNSCSVLSVLLAVGVAGLALVRGPLHRRLLGVVAGGVVAVACNQLRICGIGLVRSRWGADASFAAHEWAGTLISVGSAALSLGVMALVASRGGPRRGRLPTGPAAQD